MTTLLLETSSRQTYPKVSEMCVLRTKARNLLDHLKPFTRMILRSRIFNTQRKTLRASTLKGDTCTSSLCQVAPPPTTLSALGGSDSEVILVTARIAHRDRKWSRRRRQLNSSRCPRQEVRKLSSKQPSRSKRLLLIIRQRRDSSQRQYKPA
jgi:hypothetical protein